MAKQALTFDFPDISAKFWKQKIQADLRGADYNETLVWESPEGIQVKPFYSREDLEKNAPAPVPCPTPWRVGQQVEVGDAGEANAFSRDAIARGAEHLNFSCKGGAPDVSLLLRDIDLERVSVSFHDWNPEPEMLETFAASLPPSVAGVYLNFDPLGAMARKGSWRDGKGEDLSHLKACSTPFKGRKDVYPLGIGMELYHEAGGTRVQQLAYALAQANEYLEALEDWEGQPILFHVAVGNDYFFEIAKLRALRLLCGTLLKAHGREEEIRILAMPGKRNKTLYDYNVNLLRTSTECMAAILGNADMVVNTRYDALYHEPNEFADRIARNQLLILKHESHFDKVGNPASGSYYLERLTRQLADQALQLFKQIEKGGGYLAQLKEHTLQRKLKEAAAKEQAAFDEGSLVLVGTNKYPNPEDRMKGDLEKTPFLETRREKTRIEPILTRRLAAKHEQKRLNDE